MYTIMRYFMNLFDYNKRTRELQKKFDEEYEQMQLKFDAELFSGKDTNDLSTGPLDKDSYFAINKAENVCSKRHGVITAIESSHGVINNCLLFDVSTAAALLDDLHIGVRVEYLATENKFSSLIHVVKIEKIINPNYDKCENDNLGNEIEAPKGPITFYEIQQRTVLGNITKRLPDSIVIDSESGKNMTLKLDKVVINFVPKVGDRVMLYCNVQVDDGYVNKQGEILEVDKIEPTRIEHNVKCSVVEIHKDWGSLDNNCYFTMDVLLSATSLNVKDIVIVDMIESEKNHFNWRSIKMRIFKRPLPNMTFDKDASNSTQLQDISISENLLCIFGGLQKTKVLNVVVTNISNRNITVDSVVLSDSRSDAQTVLIKPKPGEGFELPIGSSEGIIFMVESKYYGNSEDKFCINYDKVTLESSIAVMVCETEQIAESFKLKKNYRFNTGPPSTYRNFKHRSPQYANYIWSKKSKGSIVPGVGVVSKRRFIGNQIGFYEVPERLRDTYLTSYKNSNMLPIIRSQFPVINEKLSYKNYTKRFHTLLHLEEIECFINLRQYDKERAHFTRDGDFLALSMENLPERRPSLALGDTVRAINPWAEQDVETRCYEGIIHKVLLNKLLIKFNSGFQSNYNGEDYRLEFFFSRFNFRKQHCAISRTVKVHAQEFLFPMKLKLRHNPQLDIHLNEKYELIYNNQTCDWYNGNLNNIQKDAIHKILRGETKQMPYIIFGPPGTGKTMTVVEAILQLVKLLPNARVLVGTPSNSSADLITSRLISNKVLRPGEFVRLVSYNQIDRELIPEDVMPYCATADIALDGSCSNEMKTTSSGLKMRCQMKFLGRHRVTISTCSTLGNFMQMNFPVGHFTHIIIDEAGQCTEPEVMIPICQVSANNGQVILAGDPQQLQAIVINRYAADLGYSFSFLERILQTPPYLRDTLRYPLTSGYDGRLVTKLLYNYRALPSILHVYNELFYNSELTSMVSEFDSSEFKLLEKLMKNHIVPESNTRKISHGVFFYGVRSINKQEHDSPSWFNPIEARSLFLLAVKMYRHNISADNIGIITPYTKQVKHLRNLFSEADIAMPKIGSVEEFQGQERDIILISTVRSCEKLVSSDLRHNLGFVQSAKRMNVAISRARSLLCIFGNPHLLTLDPIWHSLIQYCIKNDAFYGCNIPESFRKEKNSD